MIAASQPIDYRTEGGCSQFKACARQRSLLQNLGDAKYVLTANLDAFNLY
jgi:hypothetical protein